MKITIVGAGAIGGYLGARRALAGEDVTFVGRGAHHAGRAPAQAGTLARHEVARRQR